MFGPTTWRRRSCCGGAALTWLLRRCREDVPRLLDTARIAGVEPSDVKVRDAERPLSNRVLDSQATQARQQVVQYICDMTIL